MTDIELLWSLIDKGKRGQNVGISSGLPKLDKIIGGIQPSRYYLVGAASSVGKTSFILYVMYNMLKNMQKTKPVYFLYLSLEIGADVLLAKLMSLYCAEEFGVYLTLNDILSFQYPISETNYEYLKQAKKWIQSISDNICIIDKSVNSSVVYRETLNFAENFGRFEEIDGKRRYIPNNPNQLIIGVLDHFALMQCTEGRTLKQEIDVTSSYMVTLKRKLQMSWFVLMQQNREASSMDRRKADLSEPTLNDLRDSAGPSQDSDIVLQLFFPFREKLASYRGYRILGDNGIGQTLRSCVVTKNRYGIANQVLCLGFYGSVGWWIELPPPDEISDYSKYLTEVGNIPCKKVKIEKTKDVSTSKQVENKQPIIFNF